MRQAVVNEPFIDHVSVFEDDGYTKISGLSDPDFTFTVWVEGVEAPIPITVAEIGFSGEYLIGVVPTVEGFWKIQTFVNSNNEILVTEVEVGEHSVDTVGDQLEQIMDGGTGLFVPGDSLHSLKADLTRALGLLHHNAILDNQIYDGNTQLTFARLRVFDTEAHVPAVPGGSEVLGLLHEYTIHAEYDGLAVVKRYALKRVQ